MEDKPRGSISREYTAWCGVCEYWDQTAARNITDAIKDFKRDGWKNTRKRGWVCPKCMKEKRS